MADITYIVNQDSPENIQGFEQYSEQDRNLVNTFQVNSEFETGKNYVELHILSLSDELLESDYTYNRYAQLGNAQSSGQRGASVLTVDPAQDTRYYGYENGGVKLLYHFLNDLYTDTAGIEEFYIKSISPDRLEVALGSLTLSPEKLTTFTTAVKERVGGLSYFTGFRLNFKNNDLLISTNIDTLDLGGEKVVVVKLYEPLPAQYVLKSTLNIVEEVSDSVVYEIDSEITLETPTYRTLRSANFNIELLDENIVPTSYFNYSELFSYPVTNANNQVFSAINEKGIDVNVNYENFADFVHFSSAQERLLNFKYKVDLIASHYESVNSLASSTTGLQGVSGSIAYYESQIKGIVENFDHYERHLYYESGSTSWPKTNTTKPYINQASNTSEAVAWNLAQITSAISFDNTNYSSLVNTIPAYLREDSNNENYLTFVYMIGQHFDNLWLYSKAVTDKYDADNRPNFGISKDLVGEALKNFGIKLYTSNKSTEDLFSTFIGQSYQSGSEVIGTYITGSLVGANTPIQPTSYDSYQKEVQKRIYHNLPLLLKSKGTERGVRALINCFGIPADILQIKLYGGSNQDSLPFFGNQQYTTSSLGKVRLDNTGSIIEGLTLSEHTSTVAGDSKYTDDLHTVEIGFSPTDNINNYIISQSAINFNIDEYLGDPRNLNSNDYSGLYKEAYRVLGDLATYNVQDYVRLIKFFDNTVFKMIKDFIPARSVDVTGIVIKPNLLNISKAKSVQVSADQPEYTASIETTFTSGSHGGSFRLTSEEHSTSWGYVNYSTEIPVTESTDYVQTPFGLGLVEYHQHEEPKYNGELSGSTLRVSTGEWNSSNLFKVQTPKLVYKEVMLITDVPSNLCPLNLYIESPTVITRLSTPAYNDYDVISHLLAFNSTTGVVFTSSSYVPTNLAGNFIFPETNYATYAFTASKGEVIGCETSASFKIEYCDILGVSGTPLTIEKDTPTDLTTWFTVGTNTNTSYTASWPSGNVVGIPNPSTYSFPQPGGTEVTIILKDNEINTCTSEKVITVTYNPPPSADFSTGDTAVASSYNSSSAVDYNPSQVGYSVLTVSSPITIWVDCESPNGINGSANLYLRTTADATIPGIPNIITVLNSGYTTGHSTQYSLPIGTYHYRVQANVNAGPGNIRAVIKFI